MLYCYGRVSTDDQENSIDNQRQKLQDYAEKLGLPLGGIFLDEDQSAFSIPLRRRREGAKLWAALQPGDTVVIPAVDRAFRSNADAWNTLDAWHSMGIKLILMDMAIDTTTAPGELVFGIRLSTARYESRVNSSRQKEIFAYLRKHDRPYGGFRPFGWVRDGDQWAVCEKERQLGDRVVKMRESGMSYSQITLQLCKENIRRPVVRKNCRPWYGKADVWSLCHAAKDGYPKRPKSASLGGKRGGLQRAAGSGASAPASAT
jgi:DNA invertase Pin-like site-specific DNA recombinase